MTLSTHVYLLTEADPRDVFTECRRLLGANDSHSYSDESSWHNDDSARMLSNRIGMGLPALLMLHYRTDGPLRPKQETCDPEICDEDCEGTWHDPSHWAYIDFDTAYSYHDSHGGCGALHARLLFELGQWLDDRGIEWSWRNEFTGDVHSGDERYRRLVDLTEGGQEAMRWFKGTVEPAIFGSR